MDMDKPKRPVALFTMMVVVVLALIIGAFVLASHEKQPAPPVGKLTMTTVKPNVFRVTANPEAPVLKIYEDPMCPYCQQFEQGNQKTIERSVREGKTTVEYHMVNILDRLSVSHTYSSRMVIANAAIAKNDNADTFLKFHSWLYANKPAEGGDMANGKLIEGMKKSGASEASIKDLTNKELLDGMDESVKKSVEETKGILGEVGVPAITYNGKPVDANKHMRSVLK